MAETTQPFLKQFEGDVLDAAWRTGTGQFVKLARDPLAALISRHLGPGDESLRGKIAAFLETELGTALVSALLSAGLSALPNGTSRMIGLSPAQLARLTQELRVKAMADAGDVVADLLMGPLRQLFVAMIASGGLNLPELPATTDTAPAADLNAGTQAASPLAFAQPAAAVNNGR